MKYRQAVATYTDGRRETLHTEADDIHGRAQMEKVVAKIMERTDVVSVQTVVTNRIAGGQRGSYR